MPFSRSISSMPCSSWMPHQSVLIVFWLLREADLLALQVGHPVDVVPGAHHHHAALARRVRHAQEPGPADVGLDVDGREQAAEADQVVEVVDVVRVPVVLLAGAEVQVVDADLLVLLLGPAQLLVDVAGGHQRAVGVVHLVPVERHGAELLVFCMTRSCFRSGMSPGPFPSSRSSSLVTDCWHLRPPRTG